MKKNAFKISHETLEHLRFAAIKLKAKGVKPSIIAESLGMKTQTIYNWISIAKTKGKTALKAKEIKGAPPALSEDQFNEVLQAIQTPASEYGYHTDLWTGTRLRHFIQARFGIRYHKKYMPRFLRRLGLTLLFPERRALEQDPEAVKTWKEKELPRIECEAKKRRALLFYADETSISLIPTVGRSWSLPGIRPIVRVSGKRGTRVNVTGAVNRAGHLYFESLPNGMNFTAVTFVRFLKKLRGHFPTRNITVIVDNSSTHTAKTVKQYGEGERWLRLEYLPAYSPEWNPSEEAWGYLKGCSRNGSQSGDLPSLRSETTGALKRLQRNKTKVKTFFKKLEKAKSTGL